MHYMYMTVADLSQLNEEEALSTMKSFFVYARCFAPCVLIVDEADVLFGASDIKGKKLALLFQREFAKALDENIQLFFITNHPEKFPAPILNRLARRIEFDAPDFETQLRLFELHLKLALKTQKKEYKKRFLRTLDEELLSGLVGRDIEAICIAFSLETDGSLDDQIEAYKKEREQMSAFIDSKLVAKQQVEPEPAEPAKTPKKNKIW